ncbi:MAG: M23 family metallopeptidase [Saprospiraceae bacterium]|nr:M23 family metallopeptidase [Saprospiraceae bacterium]
MRKEKYVYNQNTLQFEKVQPSIGRRIALFSGYLCGVAVFALGIFLLADRHVETPAKKALKRDISQLNHQVSSMHEELDMLDRVVANLQERDASVHRMLLGMNPIDQNIWEGGTGGHDQYRKFEQFGDANQLLAGAQKKLDKLRRQAYLQTKSLDTLEKKAMEKEGMIASIPSIKPVRIDKLKRKVNYLSGYGLRMHPVHKVKKMHNGIDFTAPRGTPIQATGDGVVKNVIRKRTGYGQHVIIDHGYGYQTLYGHMKSIHVEAGEKVTKGQQIGTVGSTGTSTAPHCHYEVRFQGRPVNPIHYVLDGLTPLEYQDLVERASRANQSFD